MELAPARSILDLGGNCGIFSLFALTNAPHATVTAVEVQPALANALRGNCERNGFGDRLRIHNAWVGTSTEFVEGMRREVPALRQFDIERYFAEHGPCDFVKCDVEGAEFGFITPEATWLRQVNRISLEYHGDWNAGAGLGEVLKGFGFEVVQRSHRQLGYLFGIRRK